MTWLQSMEPPRPRARRSVYSKVEVILKCVTLCLFVCFHLFVDDLFLGRLYAHVTSKTTRQSFPDGDVTVFDNILKTEELLKLEKLFVLEETAWQFFPKEVDSQHCTGVPQSGNAHVCSRHLNEPYHSHNQYQWKAKLDPVSFSKSTAWREISKQILWQLRLDAKSLTPCEVNGVLTIGGDFIQSSKSDPGSKCRYAAIIFLAKKWKRNAYGEMLVYESHGEILKAVYPKYGRIVVFPCDLKHLIRPPSIGNQQHMHAIAVYFAAASLTNQQDDSTTKQQESPYPLILLHKLLSNGERPHKLHNVSNYLTRKFITNDGKPIMVFDGVISHKDLEILTRAVNYGSYHYDLPEPDSADNVQWIMQFEVDDLVRTTLWEDIKTVVAYVSGEKDCFPYDVGCNNIRYMDNTKIHNDLTYGLKADSNDQTEYTFLLYLNPSWTEDFHGETVFFANEDSPNPEMIFAVRPKHGRICVFHGAIPHSARPPSFKFRGTGARYSFAVKMATSEAKAWLKASDPQIQVLRNAHNTASDTEAQEIQQVLEKYEKNELNSSELEQIMRKYDL